MGNNEKKCRFCENLNPDESKFCNSCGKSLSIEKPIKEDEITTVNKYAVYLQRLNEDQTKIFKMSLWIGGSVFVLIIGIFGFGSYQGINTMIKETLTARVEEEMKEELKTDAVKELIEGKLKDKFNMGFDILIEDFDKLQESADAQMEEIIHERYYSKIQNARDIAELFYGLRPDKNAKIPENLRKRVSKIFNRSKKSLIKESAKRHNSKSFFEIGRIFHYYPLKYPEFFDPEENTKTQLTSAKFYYNLAIRDYTKDQLEKKFHIEPLFYLVQISIRLNLLDENTYTEEHIRRDLDSLFGELNKSKKHMEKLEKAGLIDEIGKIKIIARKIWWDEKDKEDLEAFAENKEYLDIL